MKATPASTPAEYRCNGTSWGARKASRLSNVMDQSHKNTHTTSVITARGASAGGAEERGRQGLIGKGKSAIVSVVHSGNRTCG